MPHLIKLDSEKTALAKREAANLRENLSAKCAAALDAMGDEVAGYALVVWDKSGELTTAYDASQGPIGPALVPTLVSDALNRHVAVMLAKNAEQEDPGTS